MIRRNIPNAVTCLNIVAGCGAIVFALKGNQPIGSLAAWQLSCIFIAIAAVADFLDGFCARMLHAYSNLGKELDSLCDAVSFGVAPAMLIHRTLADCGAEAWLTWTVAVIPVAAVLRLARFNIDTRQSVNFIGLPVPANAIFWIGYAALCRQQAPMLADVWFFLPVMLAESWLMISPVKIFSLKFRSYGWMGNQTRWLLIAATPVLILCCGLSGLLWTIILYLLLSLCFPPKDR